MTYTSASYFVRYTSPVTGNEITIAGLDREAYHKEVSRLVTSGIAYETGEEQVRASDSEYSPMGCEHV